MGCNDEQLKTECQSAKREIEDFVISYMEFLDDTYVRPSLDLINRLYVADRLALEDYTTLRDIIAEQRNTASEGVEERLHPDCASGLWTDTLYVDDPDVDNWRMDYNAWDLNDVRDRGICVSRSLESELEALMADNVVDRTLKIDTSLPFASETNALMKVELEKVSGNRKGLTPYSKRFMEVLLRQRNDGQDIGGLGISTGRHYIHFMLMRALDEPPDIRLPTTELSSNSLIEQGDLGSDVKCFPLNSMVLVVSTIEQGTGLILKQLSQLTLGEHLVIGIEEKGNQSSSMELAVSPIVDFAHRSDDVLTTFVSVEYMDSTTMMKQSVAASSNHNLNYGLYDPLMEQIETRHSSFGLFREVYRGRNGRGVYLLSGHSGRWLPVTAVGFRQEKGFIAPVTQSGTMLHVSAEAVAVNVGALRSFSSLEEQAAVDKETWEKLASTSVVVSCFSTLPDAATDAFYRAKRAIWGPNDNVHGAGSDQVIFDVLAHAGVAVGQLTGHLAV